MDSKLIQARGPDILCYRLRSERQKKRSRYADIDKQVLKLHREEKALCQQKDNLGWEPLVPTIQRGWKRSFVLSEGVARSIDAQFFENILEKINTTSWSYRKDFLVKKRKFGRKILVVKEQFLSKPYAWQFKKLNFTDVEKKFFHEEWEKGLKHTPDKFYVFKEPWRFVLKVQPNIIDKVRVMDELLERRIKEIDSYLEKNNYRIHLLKILYGNVRWRYRYRKPIEKN